MIEPMTGFADGRQAAGPVQKTASVVPLSSVSGNAEDRSATRERRRGARWRSAPGCRRERATNRTCDARERDRNGGIQVRAVQRIHDADRDRDAASPACDDDNPAALLRFRTREQHVDAAAKQDQQQHRAQEFSEKGFIVAGAQPTRTAPVASSCPAPLRHAPRSSGPTRPSCSSSIPSSRARFSLGPAARRGTRAPGWQSTQQEPAWPPRRRASPDLMRSRQRRAF